MNEKEIVKQSIKVFLGGEIIFIILAFIFSNIAYPLGFIVGYLISLIIFISIVKMTDLILLLKVSTIRIIGIMHLIKIGIYALGIFLAIKAPQLFSIVSMVIGYLVIQTTIYLETFLQRKVK